MLLNIPAVADTAGVVTSITWRSDNLYAYNLELWIPGGFVSGTFTDNETALQEGFNTSAELANGLIKGAGQTTTSGPKLIMDALDGPVAPGRPIVGQTSAAIFFPTGGAYLPPSFYIHVDPPNDAAPHLLKHLWGSYTYEPPANGASRGNIKLAKPPRQGSVINFLQCVNPTFTIPPGCHSFTIRNISGLDCHYRFYRPNVLANVIDTTATSLLDAEIVGMLLADTEPVTFPPGSFTPGSSMMLAADVAATGGAIVEFNF